MREQGVQRLELKEVAMEEQEVEVWLKGKIGQK
jgi:hypothetical protein